MEILLYSAPTGTKYITASQHAVLNGQILISLPNTESNAKRRVCLELFFGKSERKAIAYNETNPNIKYEVTLGGTKKKKVQYHIIIVIDNSGSMSDTDVLPNSAEFKCINNNRLGAVFDACSYFIQKRLECNPALAERNQASKYIPPSLLDLQLWSRWINFQEAKGIYLL